MTPSKTTPELLHESEGLTIVKNVKNRFCVATLFYFADPAKRSPEWAEEARAGMTDAQWAKEYMIDATALFGERVFPEITKFKDQIVMKEPHPEISPNAVCWGGLDYGSNNPSSFHVYTMDDGVIYAVWELFEPCKNLGEFVGKMKSCPYWDRIKYIACDPTIVTVKNQQTKFGIVSMGQLFMEEGVYKLLAGLQDESTWLAMMREHWGNGEEITFKIYDNCPNMIREFEGAVFVSISEKMQQTGNPYSEKILGKNNHSLDDCKYFMNSKPTLVNTNIILKDPTLRWRH